MEMMVMAKVMGCMVAEVPISFVYYAIFSHDSFNLAVNWAGMKLWSMPREC
jgi:hypothetical protein